MTPEEIPQSLIDILDKAAGKQHSRTGSVVQCLAEILTEYDQMKLTLQDNSPRNMVTGEVIPPEQHSESFTHTLREEIDISEFLMNRNRYTWGP